MSYLIVFLLGFLLATFIFQSTLRRYIFLAIIKSILWIDHKISALEARKKQPPLKEEDFKDSQES